MTVKTSVSFTERHYSYVHEKVKSGVFASTSSLIAAGIEQMIQDDIERDVALQSMKATIEKRLTLPRDEWIGMDDNDRLMEKARSRIRKTGNAV